MPYSIKVSRKRIYPGTTQILLSINVNTQLQSLFRKLSTPLPPEAIFSSYVSTRTRYQCQQGQELLIDQCLDQDTIHMATISRELSMPLPLGVISYQYPPRTQACNYQCQINWDDPLYIN